MSAIKPGDLVVVIYVDGVLYPPGFAPGKTFTVIRECDCGLLRLYRHWCVTPDMCLSERILRKVDADGRRVVKWNWRHIFNSKEVA
jgi:hypothetical protein